MKAFNLKKIRDSQKKERAIWPVFGNRPFDLATTELMVCDPEYNPGETLMMTKYGFEVRVKNSTLAPLFGIFFCDESNSITDDILNNAIAALHPRFKDCIAFRVINGKMHYQEFSIQYIAFSDFCKEDSFHYLTPVQKYFMIEKRKINIETLILILDL